MFKRDEATDDDFPTVPCDRAKLAEEIVLALTFEVDPDPVREERVDLEATLAKDARIINTFLIVVAEESLVLLLHFYFHYRRILLLTLFPPLLPSVSIP